MRVRFTATAFAELKEIHDYIAEDNPTAANAVVLRVEQLIARIAEFPLLAHTARIRTFGCSRLIPSLFSSSTRSTEMM